MISTPDSVIFNGKAYNFRNKYANPFIVFDNKVYFGEVSSTHADMKIQLLSDVFKINPSLLDEIIFSINMGLYHIDTSIFKYYILDKDGYDIASIPPSLFSQMQEYAKTGSLNWLADRLQLFGRVWGGIEGENINLISFWPGNRFNYTNSFNLKDFDEDPSSPEMKSSAHSSSFRPSDIDESIISEGTINNFLSVDKIDILKDVVNAAGFDMDNTYLCLGKSVILMSDLVNGKRINLDQSDIDGINNQQKAMHLMPAKEKWNQLQNFRNFRDQKNAEKLGKMTMAQYNALRYVDEGKNHKVNLTESQLRNIISETIRNILKQEKRH